MKVGSEKMEGAVKGKRKRRERGRKREEEGEEEILSH